jgi:hypothetical protein
MLDKELVLAQDSPGHRAIVVLTLAFASVKRAIPGVRLGQQGGRISPTRMAWRGSRGSSVYPFYALKPSTATSIEVVRPASAQSIVRELAAAKSAVPARLSGSTEAAQGPPWDI